MGLRPMMSMNEGVKTFYQQSASWAAGMRREEEHSVPCSIVLTVSSAVTKSPLRVVQEASGNTTRYSGRRAH